MIDPFPEQQTLHHLTRKDAYMKAPSLSQTKLKILTFVVLTIACVGNPLLYPQTGHDEGRSKPKKTQAKYSVLHNCPRPYYNFRLHVTPAITDANGDDRTVLELIFGYQDPYNFYRLILSNPDAGRKDTVVLLRRQDGKEAQIGSSAKRLPQGEEIGRAHV